MVDLIRPRDIDGSEGSSARQGGVMLFRRFFGTKLINAIQNGFALATMLFSA